MSEPFLAEIKIVSFNFAPRGWALLDGQILPINQNQSLYSLLGTTYGGDGRTTFALPDLRGRTPLHRGAEFRLSRKGGAETVTLSVAEMAVHTHNAKASMNTANSPNAHGQVLAGSNGVDQAYRAYEPAHKTALSGNAVANAGGGQAHENMQPYLTVNFCIALQGLFPTRN